jgi:Putative zinc-finger
MKTCAQTRESLADLLYGEVSPAETQAVQQHLAACPVCQAEYAGLRQVRAALDTAEPPASEVAVDLTRIYREAAHRQAKRLRRWRRLAVAGLAAAAVLLVAFGLKLEVRLEQHQVVLRWGTPPQVEPPRVAPKPPERDRPAAERHAEMQLVKDLIHLLADDVKTRDAQQKEAMFALRERVEALRVLVDERYAATERDVSALYTAQFGPREKGDRP